MTPLSVENPAGCDAVNEPLIRDLIDWIMKQPGTPDDWTLTIVFVNDDFISDLHERYMNTPGPTDVITFNLTDIGGPLEGEIYISCETATINADHYQVTLENELCRLSVHGMYHLLGIEDTTPEKKQRMTELENAALSAVVPKP
ncbi:MAG: rRNA maturation RNase YbeY [candidate division KSB1 bacterium]|nr:rRNA maturation RNase YbeY [candidate division KSB1 bacterium]